MENQACGSSTGPLDATKIAGNFEKTMTVFNWNIVPYLSKILKNENLIARISIISHINRINYLCFKVPGLTRRTIILLIIKAKKS